MVSNNIILQKLKIEKLKKEISDYNLNNKAHNVIHPFIHQKLLYNKNLNEILKIQWLTAIPNPPVNL